MGTLQDLNDATAAGFAAVGDSQYYTRASINPTQPPYGAVGDGVSDDTAAFLLAIQAALSSGLPIDGRGKNYAVTSLAPPVFDGLTIQNATFTGLNPNTADRKTLLFEGTGTESLTIRNVTINRNGSGTSGGLNSSGGLWVVSVDGLLLEDVEVYGDNKGNGIVVFFSKRVKIVRPYIHDIRFTDAGVTDDSVQGIFLLICSDISIDSPRTENFGLQDQESSLRDNFNRGISLGGCNRAVIINPLAFRVGQMIDLTGSDSNQNVVIVGGVGRQIFSNGIKFSNSTVGCTAIGTIVEQAGSYSFVVSSSGATQENAPKDNQFIGCKARNSGASNVGNAYGFAFLTSTGYANYPKAIQVTGCSATCDEGSAAFTVASTSTLQLNTASPISLSDGVPVTLTTTGTLPAGLSTATIYWLTRSVNSGVVSLASSYIKAQDGIAISGLSGGSGVHTLILSPRMLYGAIATGTAGQDGGAPIEIGNFRAAGYLNAATSGISIPLADVARTVVLPVNNASWTNTAPNAVIYDPLLLSAQAAAQPDFTANTSGEWTFTAYLNWAANSTGVRKMKFQVDTGSGYADLTDVMDARNACAGTEPTNQSLTWTGRLARGSKIKAQAWQNSGGSLDISTIRYVFARANDIAGGV